MRATARTSTWAGPLRPRWWRLLRWRRRICTRVALVADQFAPAAALLWQLLLRDVQATRHDGVARGVSGGRASAAHVQRTKLHTHCANVHDTANIQNTGLWWDYMSGGAPCAGRSGMRAGAGTALGGGAGLLGGLLLSEAIVDAGRGDYGGDGGCYGEGGGGDFGGDF